MAMNAKNAPGGGSTQETIEPGSYPARTVRIYDLGLQEQSFDNQAKDPRQEILMTYEHADEFMKDEDGEDIEDKPRWTSESFALHNLAADRAKSTQRYYALDPETKFDGDFTKLLDIPCVLTVVNNVGKGKNKGKTYANVAGVSAMRSKEASKAPKLVNEPWVLDLSEVNDVMLQRFHDVPEFVRKRIKEGLEWEGSAFAEALENFKPAKKDEKTEAKKTKKPVKVEEPDDDEDDEDLY